MGSVSGTNRISEEDDIVVCHLSAINVLDRGNNDQRVGLVERIEARASKSEQVYFASVGGPSEAHRDVLNASYVYEASQANDSNVVLQLVSRSHVGRAYSINSSIDRDSRAVWQGAQEGIVRLLTGRRVPDHLEREEFLECVASKDDGSILSGNKDDHTQECRRVIRVSSVLYAIGARQHMRRFAILNEISTI